MSSLGVCLVIFPYPSGSVPLHATNLAKKISLIADPLYVISEKSIVKIPENAIFKDLKIAFHQKNSIKPSCLSLAIQIMKLIIIQIKISLLLFEMRKSVDFIYFSGAQSFLLPLLCSKLLRIKSVMVKGGSSSKSYKANHPNSNIVFMLVKFLENLHHVLLDQIAVQSESSIDFLNLNKFRDKISVHGALFVDTNTFKIEKSILCRENLVGYIGGFNKGKGVLNFVNSIPLVLSKRNDVTFLLAGDGTLLTVVKQKLEELDLLNQVKLVGWISHHEIPKYLNEVKLLVLPSYSEGVPVIVQEALACGTIVLSTPVGGVPDLIINSKTGFILKSNSPENIAEDIILILDNNNLSDISLAGHSLIEQEYSLEILSSKCGQELRSLLHKH